MGSKRLYTLIKEIVAFIPFPWNFYIIIYTCQVVKGKHFILDLEAVKELCWHYLIKNYTEKQ